MNTIKVKAVPAATCMNCYFKVEPGMFNVCTRPENLQCCKTKRQDGLNVKFILIEPVLFEEVGTNYGNV